MHSSTFFLVFDRAVKVPHSKELIPVTGFSKVTRSSYKERVPKIVIVTSSFNAKKGTHVTSCTLQVARYFCKEKIATFFRSHLNAFLSKNN